MQRSPSLMNCFKYHQEMAAVFLNTVVFIMITSRFGVYFIFSSQELLKQISPETPPEDIAQSSLLLKNITE